MVEKKHDFIFALYKSIMYHSLMIPGENVKGLFSGFVENPVISGMVTADSRVDWKSAILMKKNKKISNRTLFRYLY